MAPVARRPCTWPGCDWLTPEAAIITTIEEAIKFVELHTRECIHNPTVHDRCRREEVDHQEDREAEREHRRRAEAREEARLDSLEQERREDRANKLCRETAAEEAEEAR